MSKDSLHTFTFEKGYASNLADGLYSGFLAKTSANVMVNSLGQTVAYNGESAIVGSASRQFFLTDNGFAGLGDVLGVGKGNVFKFGNNLLAIGEGQINFNGTALGASASNILSYIPKIAGTYTLPIWQAGHARPSAPTIYPKSDIGATHKAMKGAVSVVIGRSDSATGQPSQPSFVSNVLVLNDQTVIVPFPSADANNQDQWYIGCSRIGFADLSNHYILPSSAGGLVLESALAYTRTTGTATILDTSDIVDDTGGAFTSADVGRRYSFGTFDTWIKEVISATQVKVADVNGTGATITGIGTIRHAVNGILRAVEISWNDITLLQESRLVPIDAVPPVPAKFGGALQDVIFIETSEGIIYVGVPNYIGSFPATRAIFANNPAVLYLRGSDSVYWRFTKNSLTMLSYVGGERPIDLQVVYESTGITYPQNACVGEDGRLIGFHKKPFRMDNAGSQPDSTFSDIVRDEFANWYATQTEDVPIVVGYDPSGYEIYALGRKIMAYHTASQTWSSPMIPSTAGNIISCVTYNNELWLAFRSPLGVLSLAKFNGGTGTLAKWTTVTEMSNGDNSTISQINIKYRNTTATSAIVKGIRNFDRNNPNTLATVTLLANREETMKIRPNYRNCQEVAFQIEMQADNNSGIDYIRTFGESNMIFTR